MRQATRRAGLLQSHRAKRRPLPPSRARRSPVPAALDPKPAPAKAGVDGGSEFQAEFEDACQTLNLPLHVLPPKSPQFNGVVERANDRARVEFWNRYQGPLTVKDARPRSGRIPTLLQPRTAALRPGLDDPNGIPSPKQASRIRPVSDVVNPYSTSTECGLRIQFRNLWRGHSSAGRALAWHARGRRFEPAWLHQNPGVPIV